MRPACNRWDVNVLSADQSLMLRVIGIYQNDTPMCHSDVEMGTAFTTHHFEGGVADNKTDSSA